MRLILSYLSIFLLVSASAYAQRKVTKPQTNPQAIYGKRYPKFTNFAIGAGLTRSVLYLARNVKQDNDATGVNINMIYGGSKLIRAHFEYTYYWPIDIAPTWYDVKAYTVEANMHVLARFRSKKAYFYPIFGLSYNVFSGKFTGEMDFLNLRSIYEPGENVVTRWFGLNAGTGYEYYFRPGSIFLDYKMRVGRTEGIRQINIQDVCITAGIRFNIRVPSPYSIFVYRGVRSRYLLDVEEME